VLNNVATENGRVVDAGTLAWPELAEKSNGPKVKALQYLLTSRGNPAAADGIFGTNTKAAVVEFQKSVKLKADGIAGPKTLAALVAAVKPGGKGPAVSAAQVRLFLTQFIDVGYLLLVKLEHCSPKNLDLAAVLRIRSSRSHS
jgi:murein L,D-transpeptidase YcbB/YkuD